MAKTLDMFIIPSSVKTSEVVIVKDPVNVDALLREYLEAQPNEDFGMIPARCTRPTVNVRKGKK